MKFLAIAIALACVSCNRFFELDRVVDGAIDASSDAAIANTCMTDDFSSQELDPARWSVDQEPPTIVGLDAGELVFTLGTAPGNAYATVYTGLFDLSDSTAELELRQPQQAVQGAQSGVAVQAPDRSYYEFLIHDGQLVLRLSVSGHDDDVNIALDTDAHRYMRFRFLGTTAFWETSADRVTWQVRRTADQLAPTALSVVIFGGTYTSLTTPGSARFDNVRVHCD